MMIGGEGSNIFKNSEKEGYFNVITQTDKRGSWGREEQGKGGGIIMAAEGGWKNHHCKHSSQKVEKASLQTSGGQCFFFNPNG